MIKKGGGLNLVNLKSVLVSLGLTVTTIFIVFLVLAMTVAQSFRSMAALDACFIISIIIGIIVFFISYNKFKK